MSVLPLPRCCLIAIGGAHGLTCRTLHFRRTRTPPPDEVAAGAPIGRRRTVPGWISAHGARRRLPGRGLCAAREPGNAQWASGEADRYTRGRGFSRPRARVEGQARGALSVSRFFD